MQHLCKVELSYPMNIFLFPKLPVLHWGRHSHSSEKEKQIPQSIGGNLSWRKMEKSDQMYYEETLSTYYYD